MKKLFIFIIAVAGFGVSSYAQVGASATATSAATIVTPISITKTGDMNFGNVSVNANPGTVVLLPAGTRSATGGVTVTAAMGGTITAATFDVAGQANYTYSISLPVGATPVTLTHTNAVNTMTAGTFSSAAASGTMGTLSAGGVQTLNVGATLNVAGGQLAGVYTSTAFTVTVNYN
ncbi:MAG: DUF4402 domain-containing protein [Bacteroidota bacterium]